MDCNDSANTPPPRAPSPSPGPSPHWSAAPRRDGPLAEAAAFRPAARQSLLAAIAARVQRERDLRDAAADRMAGVSALLRERPGTLDQQLDLVLVGVLGKPAN